MPVSKDQKNLGFKLFGNLVVYSESIEAVVDPNKAFEIQFFPGETPLGTLTIWGREEEKKIVVDFPEEIRQNNFESICLFLLEKNVQLAVKETGYEKLGNRKLLLEVNDASKEPTVNVLLFIQGKNACPYEIELNPYDLSLSNASLKDKKAGLHMKELSILKKAEASKVLSKLKPNNFQVLVKEGEIHLELGLPLKQYMENLGKPSKYQTQKVESHFSGHPDEVVYATEGDLSSCEKPQKTGSWFLRKMIGKG